MIRRLAPAALLLLAGTACAQAPAPATAPAEGADAAAPFLWRIDAPQATHFLLGSLHLLPESAHPLPDGLARAYEATAGVVFESDIAALSAPEMQLRMLTGARAGPGGATLAPALRERLARRAAEIAMPMAMCEGFKPWFCALSLEVFNFQHAGFKPALGVDQHFHARARDDQKPLRWLEPPEEHLEIFLGMPDALSEQFLAATVDELTEAGQAPADLLRIWQRNDVAALGAATAAFRARHPAAYERLLAARNRAWVPRVRALVAEPTGWLIVVGAAHLAGPDSLVTLLAADGVAIRPVDAAR